jgi:hypothetical protein
MRFRRIDLDEASIRLRQVEAEDMQLHPHAADDADVFAEINLGMAGWMGERDETSRDLVRTIRRNLSRPYSHRRSRVRSAAVRKSASRCAAASAVGLQDRVDDWNEGAELRPLRSLGSHIAGRRRIAGHLGNRVSA